MTAIIAMDDVNRSSEFVDRLCRLTAVSVG